MSTAQPVDPTGPPPARLVPIDRPAPPHAELPLPLTSFVGREREIATVCALLRRGGVRLVTLTGPGGVGKTRLGLRVAEEMQNDFPDGDWFVPLAPVHDPALVVPTVAGVIEVWEAGGRPLVEGLQAFLRDRRALLLLDNFEQLLEAAPLVTELLAVCPRLTILATSRTALRLSGEHAFLVPPLSLGQETEEGRWETGVGRSTDEPSPDSEAIRLFVDRAQAVRTDFALTPDNAAAVAEICRRLDGLPLAIELAAARVKSLPPAALLARLERRLPLLTGGPRDAPDRLRSMRDAIAWSHDLLTPEEQALFRRLTVFAGGFTIESVEAIGRAGGDLVSDVLAVLSSLVDGSLLHPEAGADGEPRFGMLETVREFGLEQLVASGEEAAVRDAHAAWYLALAERTAPLLIDSWTELAGLERERANLRAALTWFASNEDGEALLRLAVALSYFWEASGHWNEGIAWLERALAADPRPSPAGVEALASMGLTFGRRGDSARAEALVREALGLARRLGATAQTASVLGVLGTLLVYRGCYAEAEPWLAEAVDLARRAGDADLEAVVLTQAGIAAWGRGDPVEATARLERAHALWHDLGSHHVSRRVPARHLANVATETGDFARAANEYRQFLDLASDAAPAVARVVPDIAVLAVACGEPERAARLFGAGAALAESIGLAATWPERGGHERATAAARTALGDDAFDAAFAAGRRLRREQLDFEIATVLDTAATVSATRQPNSRIPDRHDLSPRELEVLRLLVDGKSDKEIAAALAIARPTASHHVAAILAKLGCPSRAAAVAVAVRHRPV